VKILGRKALGREKNFRGLLLTFFTASRKSLTERLVTESFLPSKTFPLPNVDGGGLPAPSLVG
jgi:hypothetical protein